LGIVRQKRPISLNEARFPAVKKLTAQAFFDQPTNAPGSPRAEETT
jgi:hypothetical protein